MKRPTMKKEAIDYGVVIATEQASGIEAAVY
jgi:hypothetical protein